MESKLDEIEAGSHDWIKVINEFYDDFEKSLKVAELEMKEVEIKDEPADEVCEKCGRQMVYKMGRYGKFMACSGFPDCRNTKAIVKEINVKCPKCGGEILERKGKKKIFMVVITIRNVILFLLTSRLPDPALNVIVY